ncbi:uncharacterized protein CG43867 isoform X3 [Eupeodes corollae]|uniref:uncharacterized protein CG43867 isoform X3 n=1 Tax=Eupeodes corollae TaxID=290404 RepID=UPI0024936DEB|nr:uncharacterized protein CG43867 isoform X3 [Eupeodes corollae]
MSDEIPSGRLSQIFESLSCFSELQQRQINDPTSSFLTAVPNSTTAQSVSHNYYIRQPDGSGYYLSSGTQTFPSASSQSHHLTQHQQYYQQQQNRSRCDSLSLTSSPLMTKRATSFSGQIPLISTQGTRVQSAAIASGSGVVATSAAAIQQQQTSQSTPNSPRLMPRRSHRAPPIPAKPNAALIASPALMAMDVDAPWPQLSTLTDHLNVHQINNYVQGVPEINWQERCLELQLELHRSKNQAGRIRDMLREKLSELEQRVVEAEERAEEAEDKVRAMEQRLSEWPKTPHASSPIHQTQTLLQPLQQSQQTTSSLPSTDAEKTITCLEIAVEEQRQLRLHDARQVEAKAAKIKEWVTNKLRELEEQNQHLREQNVKCNQQLELLRNHIANQPNRHSSILPTGPVRNSLSLDVHDFASDTTESRRRSESLDPQESIRPLTSSYPHHKHRRNLSMEPQELERNLVAAVDGLILTPLSGRPNSSDTDTAHDYAEIYTPSREKLPAWMKNNPTLVAIGGSTSTTTTTSELVGMVGTPRPPTPPLHRFPSWEAKIYQVANDGLAATEGDHEGKQLNVSNSQNQTGTLGSANGSGSIGGGGTPSRAQQTASGGFCDISVPVYATVKGRASQIRSIPFTGDSSDDSSDGEEHAVMMTHNSHNSSSTDNTETSTSGSASSPSKSLKTSSSLSPAKRSGSESPKNKTRVISDISFESGLSDDYAIPPDAVSESTCMDASMPSLLMRASYVDSPNRKLESLEKAGHLAKLGGKLKTWRKRWFVLKNGSLTYWKSQHDINRKPQGQIILDEVCRINRAEGASTFEIDTGKKVYYLTADSNATMDDWIRVLQNVQRRNATKLLLSRDDQKPTVQGWVTKVKNGHAKKCWCVLLGKMFLYFKAPGETNPLGQINMRDARVEEVEHVSDSDSEEREDAAQSQARLTVSIYPAHQGPTYLILPGKQERDNWLYHLTVVSGGGPNAGTQYEQLVQKLMETDGDPNCVLWRHPILLHTKDTITSPLSSLHSETIQPEAIKLFKSCQLFMSVAVNQPGIDYHVVLAQNALQHCLDIPELQTEMICILTKQTSRHTGQKLSVGVQQLLLCATQSLFTCDTQQGGAAQANGSSPTSIQAPAPPPIIDCKSNPPAYTFVQGWQLLSLAVSLFVPKSSRLLWYLKLHLSRNADTKTETGKYAAYCERALDRTLKNGGRETKPSRMEVLSILLKNPYHHSLPHAIPVHMMNSTYTVISFDGSTTIEEFQSTLAQEIGSRDSTNGFCLFSDDPIEKDLEHYLDPQAKLCDVISKWETALREKGSGKFENSRVIQLTYKNRLYWKHTIKFETDKEKLLLCYQTNQQIVQGRFPLSRDLALELSSLMSQIDMGDYSLEKSRGSGNMNNAGLKALDKFYPYRYRDAMSPDQLKDIQDLLISKWILLKGRSTLDCVRIYLTCCRKWPFFGAALFQAKPRHSDQAMAWLAVSEDALNVLELSSMAPLARYPYTSVMTFGGCQDDFMLVVGNDDNLVTPGITNEQKLLFAMSKPKILEITLLIADYMNALGHTLPGTPQMNTLTRNGSHRSLRSRPLPGACIAAGGGTSTNATTTAHNTLNSHATHTLSSNHSHTLNSHYSGMGGHTGGSHQNTMSSSHGGQPDILKSTPDHQRLQK